jgi:hypothetical protein
VLFFFLLEFKMGWVCGWEMGGMEGMHESDGVFWDYEI